jgi:glycosyltransferase involved in cell wall biosynthesis
MNAFDVLVHVPVEPEPFGRVVAEAMARAVPVVASRSGGIEEIMEDGREGFFVDAADAGSVAAALAFLLDDPPLAAEMGVRGCETYWARFTVERLRREVERLYELALLGCPKRLTAEDGGRVERGEEFTPRPASSPEQPALEGSRRGDCARAA